MAEITIKDELIACVKSFTGVPNDKQAVIDHTLAEIKAATISNDEKGKQFAGGLLNLLSELIPEINTPDNRFLTEKLKKKINEAIAFELVSISRKPR